MSDGLIDALVELFDLSPPDTERGLVVSFTAVGVVLASAMLWSRHVGIALAAAVVGAAGVWVSMLHLTRNRDDRRFGWLCFGINVAAVLVALAGVVGRQTP